MCANSQGLTARELMSLFDSGYRDVAVMLYRAYIDDSSDGKHQVVMVAGAIVGTHQQWMKLRKKWKKRLKQDGLDYFRSSEYRSLRGQFQKFCNPIKYPIPRGSEAAKAVRDDLDEIIRTSGVMGMSNVIPLEMFRGIVSVPEIRHRFNPDPFSAVMQAVMRDVVMYIRKHCGDNLLISFVCDDGPNAHLYLKAYQDFKLKNGWIADMMKGLAPQDDKLTPQLQAADVVASISREMAMEYLETHTKVSLKRLEGSFYKMNIWKPETVCQVAGWQR